MSEELLRDVELRLVDPSRKRFRLYGLTRCRTLFGQRCLRIVWGRIGHKRLRERSETFDNELELEQRWAELLVRRRRHGYVPLGRGWEAVVGGAEGDVRARVSASAAAEEIVESHGLGLRDVVARRLVHQWARAASDLQAFVRARGKAELDLEDVSSLAAMYADVAGVA